MGHPDSPPPAFGGVTFGLEPGASSEGPRDLTGLTLGDFQVERLLGQGGMGEVYLGQQLSLRRPVALKVLRSALLADPKALSRFEAEAWSAARLNHPNIVHIYTLGLIDRLQFIAMEYVQGITLRDYLAKKGPPPLGLALSIMRQAGLAVGAAGEVGLIHRDIKPENLLMTRKGQVKVADFGLCRAQGRERVNLTQPGVLLGTPLYMSPEQVQGLDVDHRSDLYSLGVTFYHMLAGVPPFQAESALVLAMKHVREEPVSLGVHRPDLPADLVRMVMKLIAKAPTDRYQTSAEMLRDLAMVKELVRASSGWTAATAPVSVEGEGASAISKVGDPIPARSRRAWVLAPLLILCAVVGAILGWKARGEDLTSAVSTAPKAAPDLSLVVDWRRIPRQHGPREQYRHAQIVARPEDREAAWRAVPGYFPDANEWVAKADLQLARHLFRAADVDRLRTLVVELEQPGPIRNPDLAAVVRAALAALRDDKEDWTEVRVRIQSLFDRMRQERSAIDPGLAEFSLVVARRARSKALNFEDDPRPWKKLDDDLLDALRVDPIDREKYDKPG